MGNINGGESLSHLIGARRIALFEHAVFIVHVGMGSDFAKGHFISTQTYGHNPNSNNYNLQGICFVWLEGIKSLLGRGYYFSGFVTVFHTQKHAKMVYCFKNCEKNCFCDREKILQVLFLAFSLEFAKLNRSLEQFIQTVKQKPIF